VITTLRLDRIGVGIDTARYGHRVAFLRPDLSRAAPSLTVMETREGYQALENRLRNLREHHPEADIYVRIDAAGQYAVNLELFLRNLDLGMIVSVGEPKRNKDYRKAHFPKRTNDDTESLAMARFAVVELPQATPPPSMPVILLREACGRLQTQVKQTTQVVNRLHNLLARAFPEFATLTEDIATGWTLTLLEKYPTAERIAQAHLASLVKIPYLSRDKAQVIHRTAQESVATLRGALAEALIRAQVAQVRASLAAETELKKLLSTAFGELPDGGHRRVVTIPGIGEATAAVLVAKIVDINRFATPESLVNYFGIFPEENSSGVDKRGRPLPPGTLPMSRKGNDLVRCYLWNATRVAIQCNPAIRAQYHRLKSRGKRGDVAMGHCMRKLLHLVFAVWKTNRPFNGEHFPWGNLDVVKMATPDAATAAPADAVPSKDQKATAAGHTRALPARKVVTAATSTVESASSSVKPAAPRMVAKPPAVDFAFLREQVRIVQVLDHLGLTAQMRGRGHQRRGPCPVHGQPTDANPTFSVHLGKNLFRCFHAGCQAQGNVLDLWAAIHKLPLYEAALHLAATFKAPWNREEEPVQGTRHPATK
jgi:transposase